jgi:hypothetical protein
VPLSCSTSVLTGVDGSIQFQPAGTQYCLTATDLPVGNLVTVPADHDFRIGDLVKFTAEGAATLDTNLPAGGVVKVIAKPDATHIEIGDQNSGAPIALAGDSSGSTAKDHIAIDLASFDYVCQVKEFSLDLSREEIDTTSLPCGVGGGSGASAPFRTMQAGYASGSGTMTVQFTEDQNSLANRLLSNSMRKNQSGAEVRLFVNAVSDGSGKPDLTKSLYVQAPISIMGFSISVTPDDVTTAELNFSLSGQPTHLFV